MTIPTNVIAYLRQQAPHAYCDECIGQKLGAQGAQAEADIGHGNLGHGN
jgi:hypothetical protein